MNKHRGLIVVVLAFLAVRLLYPLLFVPPNYLIDPEDLARGAIAHDLTRGGLKVPFWDYLADYYSGGSIVVGLLAVPFFWLFGSTLFALRLVPTLFALGVLLAWYAFVARNFSNRAALFTACFFVLPPQVYLEGSSLAMGHHPETMLFSAVGFLLLFEMLRRDDGRLSWPVGLGLCLGFGTWFCYTTFVSVAIVLAWWFWHDRRFVARRSFAVFLIFFALGFSPWIFANLSHQFRGMEFLEDGLRYHYLRGLPETAWRIAKTALWCLPTMFVLDPFHDGQSLFWPVIDTAIFGAALLYVVGRERDRASLAGPPPSGWFFAAASIVYVLAVSVTRYGLEPFGSLYLAPMLPFFFASAGVFLSRLHERGGPSHAVALTLVAVPLVGGGLGLWHRLDFRWPGASFTMPGYSYAQLAESIELRHPREYPYFATLLPRIERTMAADERAEFLRHLWLPSGYNIRRDDIDGEARRFAQFPEPERSIGYFQLGIMLRSPLVRADEAMIARLSREYPWIAEGVRLHELVRRFKLPGLPVVDRLPLPLAPDARLLFADVATYDASGEVGWVRGEETAAFLIESSREISSLAVRLTNGDRPNSARLATARGVTAVDLAPGQSVVETVELGPGVAIADRYYWTISVASRAGHFPILTRREPDTRYLGVHVAVRLDSGARALVDDGAGARP
jgi:4-amino-4-deoxy-L-arabinose transferase-like glycosyltransferase